MLSVYEKIKEVKNKATDNEYIKVIESDIAFVQTAGLVACV